MAHAGVSVVRKFFRHLATEAPAFVWFTDVILPVLFAALSLSPTVDPIDLTDDPSTTRFRECLRTG